MHDTCDINASAKHRFDCNEHIFYIGWTLGAKQGVCHGHQKSFYFWKTVLLKVHQIWKVSKVGKRHRLKVAVLCRFTVMVYLTGLNHTTQQLYVSDFCHNHDYFPKKKTFWIIRYIIKIYFPILKTFILLLWMTPWTKTNFYKVF